MNYLLRQINEALSEPQPKLQGGVVYSGGNGRLICCKCAGQSALYTGRDLDGTKVLAITPDQFPMWAEAFGPSLSCEEGCTTISLTP